MVYLEWESVTNVQWANPEHRTINMDVKFKKYNEILPFTANPDDCEAHGRDLYQSAINGDFGAIAEWTPPPLRPLEMRQMEVRIRRDGLLQRSDFTQLPDVQASLTDERRTELIIYRQALRDITENILFATEPEKIVFPEMP